LTRIVFLRPSDENGGYKANNPADRLRLISLGLFLIVFGAIAFVAAYRNTIVLDDVRGLSAIFGGVAIIFVSLKLGTLRPCVGWISTGTFYFSAGLALRSANVLSFDMSAALFCILFQLSAFCRIWIGLHTSPRNAAVWLLFSGVLATIGAILIGFAFAGHATETAPLVVALDTIFFGVSIAQFGSLRGP
jgi:uncharacterized membrane protein HdeD (DUF308 family)